MDWKNISLFNLISNKIFITTWPGTFFLSFLSYFLNKKMINKSFKDSEGARVDRPKVDGPKVDRPKVDRPKVDIPKNKM